MSTVIGYLVGQVGEFSGHRVAIPDKGLILRRDPNEVDVVLDHLVVSRRHARQRTAINCAGDAEPITEMNIVSSRNSTTA